MYLRTVSPWVVFAAVVWTMLILWQMSGVKSQEVASAHPRQSRSTVICNSWSPWINDHHPSAPDGEEAEFISNSDLEAACPPSMGGKVTKFQCRDDRGEPFSGNVTSTPGGYTSSCTDVHVGVVCKPLDSAHKCPDYAMQFYCECPANYVPPDTTTEIPTAASTELAGHMVKHTTQNTGTTTRRISKVAITKTKAADTHTSTTEVTENKTGNNQTSPNASTAEIVRDKTINIGGQEISLWVIMIVVCVLCFIINCAFTIIMYKRLSRRIRLHQKQTQIEPLYKV